MHVNLDWCVYFFAIHLNAVAAIVVSIFIIEYLSIFICVSIVDYARPMNMIINSLGHDTGPDIQNMFHG